MREAGLLVTLNTDDPALIDLDLTEEFTQTAEVFGWTWEDLVLLSLDAVDAAWLDDDERRRLRDRVNAGAALAAKTAI